MKFTEHTFTDEVIAVHDAQRIVETVFWFLKETMNDPEAEQILTLIIMRYEMRLNNLFRIWWSFEENRTALGGS
jgi:hypothetical protein